MIPRILPLPLAGRLWMAVVVLLLLIANSCCCTSAVDIVAILPDRSTAYPNGVHNGLWLSAKRLNLTLDVRSVGNFDPAQSHQVLSQAIDNNNNEQPTLYCIWPIDDPSRTLMQELYRRHQVPIIQMNQLPSAETQWEWDHLLAYAGPDDALRARNAGIMLQAALENDTNNNNNNNNSNLIQNVVALGYPATYAGYGLSINAFSESLTDSNLQIVEQLPLDWGTQPAYEAVLQLFETYKTVTDTSKSNRNRPVLHGIYAMDDSILMGVYQALEDLGIDSGKDIIVVGTVCNGARELLVNGAQYGTTVQSPSLEGQLAMELAAEYIGNNNNNNINPDMTIAERTYFTPNPITTNNTWDSMFVDFRQQVHTVDELCTWSIFYERVAGPTSVDQREDICSINVDCEYVPQALFAVGYSLAAINYALALVAGILLYIHRDKKIVKIAQPFFLGLVIMGTLIDNTSILFMSRDGRESTQSELDAACKTWPILLSVGHMVTTATLVAKIYRIKILLNAGSNFRRVEVTIRQVSTWILLFVGIDALVIIIWYSLDPIHWSVEVTASDFNGYITDVHGLCSSDGDLSYIYPLVLILMHLGVLIYANILAYQTSAFHKLSDSKSVAIALFNSIQLLVIAVPILALVGDNVTTSYLIRICFVFLNNFGVLCLIVLPKMWQCAIGNGDIIPDIDFAKTHGRHSFSKNAQMEQFENLSRFPVSSKSSGGTATKQNGEGTNRDDLASSFVDKKSVKFEDDDDRDSTINSYYEPGIDSSRRRPVVSWSEQLSDKDDSAPFTCNERMVIPESVVEGEDEDHADDTTEFLELNSAEARKSEALHASEKLERIDSEASHESSADRAAIDSQEEEPTSGAKLAQNGIDTAFSQEASKLTPEHDKRAILLDKTDSTYSVHESWSTGPDDT